MIPRIVAITWCTATRKRCACASREGETCAGIELEVRDEYAPWAIEYAGRAESIQDAGLRLALSHVLDRDPGEIEETAS